MNSPLTRDLRQPTPPPGHPEDAAKGGRAGEWAGAAS